MRKIAFIIIFFTCLNAVAQERKVTLLFAGDAMQHSPQIAAAKTDTGYAYDRCFRYIKEKITAKDIACINFETTLGSKPYKGYPRFSAPDAYAIALKNAGFDVFFTANNHCLDRGKKGLERTIAVLDTINIKHTGTFVNKNARKQFYPLMITKNGIRMAFLNYTYGTNGINAVAPNIVNLIDYEKIKEDIKTAKQMHADIIIANIHWGNEYQISASKNQKEIAKLLHDNGVRIVIGHHPHVIQPMEISHKNDSIQDIVFYSLGNFISNQRKINTSGGALAEITLSQKEDGQPVTIESCNYSLFWVHKFFENKKYVYEILPIAVSDSSSGRNMSVAAQKKMRLFTNNAKKIIDNQ